MKPEHSYKDMILGLDCGGSKTTALLGSLKGDIIGRGNSSGANFQTMSESSIRSNLRQAVNQAFTSAGVEPGPVGVICLGMAGVDRPAEYNTLKIWLREECFAEKQIITNDGRLLLWAGTPAGWGLGLVSGTGSIVIGRNKEGQMARAGGWGYILGDKGSGYALGKAALQVVTQAADSILPPTVLTALILDFWDLNSPQELIPKVYNQNTGRREIAALAPPC